ncbi:hypothetical protein [Salinarimonas soli]|uniref:Uncharacterized protein n=1 Tax=Salinarimonas soli TaxID=1638099 RepID=A0A5B2VB31_9HYPH|nr:hypothetical protein [Salinarimonas soli]KAA2235612.1 hypothetical protein F0L46_19120 [Salinarimonas soli]
MLSASRRLLRPCADRPDLDVLAELVDFAAALPGVIARNDGCGRVTALGLREGDAMGPPDALFADGTFARRHADHDGLEVILPERLWQHAVSRRLARAAVPSKPDATSRVTHLAAPSDGLGRLELEELVEGAWAYARGL